MDTLPRKLKELRDGIEANRQRTLELVSGLSEEEFGFREGGEWSVGLILEHLVVAETGTSKVIRKVLKEGAGKLPPYPADDSGFAVRELNVRPQEATNAPEAARPGGGLSKDEVLGRAAAAREQTLVSIGMMAGADPRAGVFPHAVFGEMNLYEWAFVILLLHERQHHGQIARIVETLRRRTG